jgi:tetraacyldisaccharide 4'-kinase
VNPLSSLYGIATAARNGLYDRGVFKSHKLLHPVISVGNISVGGSGKTPFVILLGELLKQRGIAFDVLSRGYGRETHGAMIVDPNGTSRDFGDEPLLIARRLGCPVIIGESRYQAGKLAEAKFVSQRGNHVGTAALGCPPGQRTDPQLHILDDGFQHRSLARDFDIVLLTSEDLHDQLLPAGRLREPISSLHRADAIVLTEEIDPASLLPGKFVWRVRRGLTIPTGPKNPIVFCGIARPHKFVEQLRAAGIQPVAEKFNRDHHKYTPDDIRDLLELRNQKQAGSFVTTEKDAINLGQYLGKIAPVIARVEMELVDAPDVMDTILRVIAERRTKA